MKTIQLELTIEETNLILEALGQMPFARVFALIGRIQDNARQQLEQASDKSAGINGTFKAAEHEHVR
jgi:hypothetical protein